MHAPLRLWAPFLLAGGLLLGPAAPAQAQQPPQLRPTLRLAPGQDSLLRLGGLLTLEARGLPPDLNAQHLTLYLNGLPLRGLAPLAAYARPDSGASPRPAPELAPSSWPDSAAGAAPLAGLAPPALAALAGRGPTRVVFALRRAAAPAAWALADGPPWQPGHPVRLGLGTAHRLLAEVQAGRAGAAQLAPAEGWGAGLIAVLLAGGLLLVAAARSRLLRAPVAATLDADGQPLPVVEAAPPYSLARVQLAWWSALVLGGGLVSAGVTGALPALPATTLGLLGVSVGAVVLAALAPVRPPEPGDGPSPASQGWLADLLCDEHGLAIHRLQFVLTSLVVGSCLGYAVYSTGVLPTWPPKVALLLALSALAYVGPKWRRTGLAALAPAPPASPLYVAWPAAGPVGPGAPAELLPPAAAFAAATHPDATPALAATAPPAAPPPAPVIAPLVAAAPVVAAAVPLAVAVPTPEVEAPSRSRADLTTGEVLHHEEDDMGPLDEEDYPSWPTEY